MNYINKLQREAQAAGTGGDKFLSTKEIIEGNKLIAEFMGFPIKVVHSLTGRGAYETIDFPEGTVRVSNLDIEGKYDTDWNYLMPVVQKIKVVSVGDSPFKTDMSDVAKEDCQIFHLSIFSEIKTVWQAVIGFIQWYNQQSKKVSK